MPIVLNGLPSIVLDAGVPANAPVIVAMHGLGANEMDLLPAFRELEGRAVLAFPRAPLAHPPGYAWYQLIRVGVPEPMSFEAAQRTLGGWIEELRAITPYGDRPLILAGFSQGAMMALSYALAHPDHVAGVMAFSGYIPAMVLESAPRKDLGLDAPRFFLSLGKRDHLFPFSRLQETATALEDRGIRPTVVPHEGGHEIPSTVVDAAGTWFSREFPPREGGH